jgi:serine/threonine-protein kinase RsbW
MGKPFFVKEFQSTTAAVAETLSEALETLAEHDWISEDRTFCIRLCLEEALVNAVIHGNKNCPECKVLLEISQDGDSCLIRIQDEGEGFDPEAIKMAECTQAGGRGVCLIKEFMDEVSYNAAKNSLDMRFNRSTFSEACA